MDRVQGTKAAGSHPVQIDRFFTGPGARGDQWQNLVKLAEAWSDGSGSRAKFETALGEMAVTEGFYAYPGLQLMTACGTRPRRTTLRRRPVISTHPGIARPLLGIDLEASYEEKHGGKKQFGGLGTAWSQ